MGARVFITMKSSVMSKKLALKVFLRKLVKLTKMPRAKECFTNIFSKYFIDIIQPITTHICHYFTSYSYVVI